MPLLRNGQWADNNPWTLLEDDDALPIQSDSKTPLLCSLKRFIELNSLRQPHSVSGVWLTPDDDVMRLAGHLDHLQLVVIDFPAYTDGRGYTQARLLRKHLGAWTENYSIFWFALLPRANSLSKAMSFGHVRQLSPIPYAMAYPSC